MSRLVAQARTWVDRVPYLHQGSNRFGADCRGFIRGVYAELKVELPDYRAYGTEADPPLLLEKLTEALGAPVAVAPVRYTDLELGDIIVFHFPRSAAPRHLAIVADRATGGFNFIEANGNERRVLERRLDERYLARVTHVFRRPV